MCSQNLKSCQLLQAETNTDDGQQLQASKSSRSASAPAPRRPPAVPSSPAERASPGGLQREATIQPGASRHHLAPPAIPQLLCRGSGGAPRALSPALAAGGCRGAQQPRGRALAGSERHPAHAGRLASPRRLWLHQHERMLPPCQGKQRRDQTIRRTAPQLPALCISGGERSQPVWTARWQAGQRSRSGPKARLGVPAATVPCVHKGTAQSIPPSSQNSAEQRPSPLV